MTQTTPYILHGHDVSYFSGKVRPAFPYKGLWYREVLPDIPMIKQRTGLNYFPAVETPDGELWQDTSDILDALEREHPSPPLYPTTPVQRVVAYLVELYADEVGLLPAMHYRWSFDESVAKVAVDFSTPTRNPEGGKKFAAKMGGSLPFIEEDLAAGRLIQPWPITIEPSDAYFLIYRESALTHYKQRGQRSRPTVEQ